MKIEREILQKFAGWKDKGQRKPILLKGARQIGKTWAMEEFGRRHLKHTVKFDFDRQPELKSVFRISKEPQRILKELELYASAPIIPGETLIIFDEIQEKVEVMRMYPKSRRKETSQAIAYPNTIKSMSHAIE